MNPGTAPCTNPWIDPVQIYPRIYAWIDTWISIPRSDQCIDLWIDPLTDQLCLLIQLQFIVQHKSSFYRRFYHLGFFFIFSVFYLLRKGVGDIFWTIYASPITVNHQLPASQSQQHMTQTTNKASTRAQTKLRYRTESFLLCISKRNLFAWSKPIDVCSLQSRGCRGTTIDWKALAIKILHILFSS